MDLIELGEVWDLGLQVLVDASSVFALKTSPSDASSSSSQSSPRESAEENDGDGVNGPQTLEEFLASYGEGCPRVEEINLFERKLLETQLKEIWRQRHILPSCGVADKPRFTYYGNPICPYAHRALLALQEKEIPYEFKPILLRVRKPTYYYDIHPRGEVPSLVAHKEDGDETIIESDVILEYLERACPERVPHLLPRDPIQRAAAKLFPRECHKLFTTTGRRILQESNERALTHLCAALHDNLREMNYMFVKQSTGPFYLGTEVSSADISVFPFVLRWSVAIKHYRNFDIWSLSGIERIRAWFRACENRRAFRVTSPPDEAIIVNYSKIVNPSKVPPP